MSKRKIVFTDTMVKKLRSKENKFSIGEGNGFNLRVMPSGSKTWLYVYAFEGVRREMNLGGYPAVSLEIARNKFEDAKKKVKNGIDPLEEGKRAVEERLKHPTVSELIDEYLENFAKEKKRTWKEDERILKKDVLPIWGDRKTDSIDRRDVLLLIDGMKGRGDAITLNTFKIIRRMFKYALKKGIVSQSPCYGFEKGDELPIVPSRERTLSESEIKTLWNGLAGAAISSEIQRALKLILVTCQRPGEVIAMHHSQIDGRWWEFMPKQTKVTKEIPRPQRIYLTDLALELIGAVGEGYVFPSPLSKLDTEGKPIQVPMTERAVAYAVRRNLKGYKGRKPSTAPKASRVKEEQQIALAHFVPHDLRRTGATFISSIGFSDEIVDAVLAHLKKGIIKTYNLNKYDSEKQAAMEAWERKLNFIITGTESNIISIQEGHKKPA